MSCVSLYLLINISVENYTRKREVMIYKSRRLRSLFPISFIYGSLWCQVKWWNVSLLPKTQEMLCFIFKYIFKSNILKIPFKNTGSALFARTALYFTLVMWGSSVCLIQLLKHGEILASFASNMYLFNSLLSPCESTKVCICICVQQESKQIRISSMCNPLQGQV